MYYGEGTVIFSADLMKVFVVKVIIPSVELNP